MTQTTQDAVLDSASRCFTRFGYKKTSMDDVAAEARVAKGTVYLYCENKSDLFYRTVERDLRSTRVVAASQARLGRLLAARYQTLLEQAHQRLATLEPQPARALAQ